MRDESLPTIRAQRMVKLRWGDQTRGQGKRGGLRIIYLLLPGENQVWLYTLYGKGEADDLTPMQKAQLRAAVEAELKHRQEQRDRRQGRKTRGRYQTNKT